MANEKITVNGNSYKAKELDFNFLCELGENGIEMTEIGNKLMQTLRVYIAYCMGVDAETAGNEISNHCINGGNMTELIEVLNDKAQNSDFFRSMGGNSTSEKTESSKSNSKKKEKEVSE